MDDLMQILEKSFAACCMAMALMVIVAGPLVIAGNRQPERSLIGEVMTLRSLNH